jgi:glycosyltransferase involved in cell wall biosynthesis
MLTGTLPIASKVGGVPEIVQETYAEHLLFTPGDVNEMVDKMELVASLSKEQLIDIRFKLRESS